MVTNNFRRHFIYWILPAIIILACILIFFFNFYGWSHYIASEENREFGVLEHLQSIVILILFFITIKGASIKKNVIEKTIFILAAAISLFMFLEEVDYGLHYYEWIAGIESKPPEEKLRNVHNNGNITNLIKTTTYIFLAVFLVALPLLNKFSNIKHPLITYFSPSIYIVLTIICLFAINQFAFYLYRQNFHTNRTIDGNISEFEEFMIYYAIMLYIKEMASSSKAIPMQLLVKKRQDNNN